MSSKKLLFIISLVVFASILMSFNANPERNTYTNSYPPSLVETDTLPDNMQDRVVELRRKREQIRKEVQRLKDAKDAEDARIAEAAEKSAKKANEKANKEAIAQMKAEDKAKSDAIKKQQKAERKAEADRLKAIRKAEKLAQEKNKQREAGDKLKAAQDPIAQQTEADKLKAKRKAEADRLKAIRKAEADKLAQEKKRQREIEATAKAKLKAEQDAIAQQERAKQKAEADRLKAIRKAEADKLAQERKRQREIEATAKAKLKAEQDAIAQQERVKQKAEADKLKALRKEQREIEAALKADQKAEAKRLKATDDAATQTLKDKVAKARANVNAAVSEEDALKAAQKHDAQMAKAAKQKERAIAKAARAKEREAKAALRDQQKAQAAAIATQLAAERKAQEEAAAQAGLVNDEDPPGYETKPEVTVLDTTDDPRLRAESIEVANKSNTGDEVSNVKTEPILPPPPPATAPESKTKNAVAKALNRDRKKRGRKGSGIKLPGMGSKSEDVSSDMILEECDFEFNEFDPITQKVKRGLSHRYFFSYTSDILKEYMQGEDYLVCTGGLIDIQGIIALSIKYEIDSPKARYEYGSIGTNAQMILQLIDGETITLLTEQSDSGRVNSSTGKTEYSTIFLINPREERTLRKTEISAVRMVWGTGYEDYEVNELDFLINQFQCIDAARDN